ncbi:MAG: hypothetical protein ACLFQL_13145 [Paracoccaceae bacterium]
MDKIGSHLISKHSMDDFHAKRVVGMMADAGPRAMTNPPANLKLQARFDTCHKPCGCRSCARRA